MPAVNGKMLRDLRMQRGLSQQKLAEKSGVAIATIKRLEGSAAERNPHATSVSRLATALGVEMMDLAEDQFRTVVDIGGDLEIPFDTFTDPDELRAGMEKVIMLAEKRSRYLRGLHESGALKTET